MAMVAGVTMVFVFVFCFILLFHFVQQNRYNTATQLESIARSVRQPLSAAILKADIPEAETILGRIQPSGIVSRADVVLPNQFQALRMSFIPERPVPVMITRIFELPVQISLPLYSLERPAKPTAAGLSGASVRFVPHVQIRDERPRNVGDCLLTFSADPHRGADVEHQPPDCAPSARDCE
jgi:diguanylate cyclase/phosphodiesterase